MSEAIAEPVVVIVRVPTPRFAPKWLVRRKMRAAKGLYSGLAGLSFKCFTFERASGDFGGIYFWADRAAARSWFDDAWFARVRRERGAEASVRMLAAPLTIDNVPGGTPAADSGPFVATLVEVPIPPEVGEQAVRAGFTQAEVEHRTVPGLLRKHFVISDHGTFGGVYLWENQKRADAWFTPAWHRRVRDQFGADAVIETFDAPILLPTAPPPS